MKTILILRDLLALAILGLSASPARADKYVMIDVQFLVLVPTDTTLAEYTPATLTAATAAADALVNAANVVFDRGWRGLRYRRFGNVQFVTAADVGDSDDADTINDIDNLWPRVNESDSAWYSRAFTLPYTLAPARPGPWKYRTGMANFYLLNGPTGGGIGSLTNQAQTNENLLVQSSFAADPGIHELGHWFAIPHPFWSTQTDTPLPVGDLIQWGDDGIDDTLKDWHQGGETMESLAQQFYNTHWWRLKTAELGATENRFRDHYTKQFYNTTYASASAAQQQRIDLYLSNDQTNNNSFLRQSLLIRDLIANGNFGSPGSPVFFASLSAGQQTQVDNLIMNIESYHIGKGGSGWFSEKQLDRMCDAVSAAYASRDRTAARALESGRYWFFGGSTADSAAPNGSSLDPLATPAQAHNAVITYPPAVPVKNDVLIGRPGNYPATNLRINKPCVIRATQSGSFSVGR